MKPLLGLAALAAVAATTVAGEPEPRAAKQPFDFQSRRAAIVPWIGRQPESRVIASQARGVLAIETSVGPVSVWVAPTRGGGECRLIDIAGLPPRQSGSICSPRPVQPDYIIRTGQSETRVGDRDLKLLQGRVTPAVHTVEVRFADGTTDRLKPAGGFFLRELDDEEEPVLVVARDRAGAVLREEPMPGPRSFRRDLPFPIGAYREVIELETSRGHPMTFAVAPGTNASVCERTVYRGAQAWGCGPGPTRLAPDAVNVHRGLWNESEDGKPVALLEGSVGREVSRLEVWYSDGSASRIPVVEQYVLFELPKGRSPRVLVGLDESGAIVARRMIR